MSHSGRSFQVGLLCAATLVLSAGAWAKTYRLTSTKIVPAASGEVKASKDKNGNIGVTMKAENLAKPGMLEPAASVYVLWFKQPGMDAQSQGQLRVGNNLKTELKTTTPLHNFDVFITAEGDPSATVPSERVLVEGKVQE